MGRKESDGSGDEFDKAKYAPAMPEGPPVCEMCRDTHLMWLHDSSGDSRQVMCTRCPTPCEGCRSRSGGSFSSPGVGGPYCQETPCACACHPFNAKAPPPVELQRHALFRHHERCLRASDPVNHPVITCSCEGGTKARRAKRALEAATPIREEDAARDAQATQGLAELSAQLAVQRSEAAFGRQLLRVIYPQTPTGPIPEATWISALAQLEVLVDDARARRQVMVMPEPIRRAITTDASIANLRSAFGALFARARGPSASMRAYPAISVGGDGLVGLTMWPAEAEGFVAVVQELIHLAARVSLVPATPPAPPKPPAPPPIMLAISDRALHQTLANVLSASQAKDLDISDLRGKVDDLEALAHELVEIADDASSALPPNAQDRWDELVAKVRG